MKSKITLELENASWMDADVLTMMLREHCQKIVADYNEQNNTSVALNNVSYDHPMLHKRSADVKPLPILLEENAKQLYPENIVKKKDASRKERAAYIKGGIDAQDILGAAYRDGIPVEELF
jgi:uncharacterized protein YeaC (DUF1315 family)